MDTSWHCFCFSFVGITQHALAAKMAAAAAAEAAVTHIQVLFYRPAYLLQCSEGLQTAASKQ